MRKFRVLWVGQLVSLLGSGLTSFALGVWVFQRTGSVTQYAAICLLALLPGVVISPLAGTVADRFSRRAVLLLCDGAGIAGMAALVGLYSAGVLRPWQIYLTTGLASVTAAFQLPAFASSVTLLVPKKQIDRANGMVTMAQAGLLVAPVLAGFLLAQISLEGVILADAASFMVNSAALLLVRIPRPGPGSEDPSGRDTVLAQWLAGWRYVTARPGLLSLIGYFSAVGLCVGFVDVLLIPIVLGFASVEALGMVLTIGAIGLAAGSMLMTAWGGPSRRMHAVLGFSFPLGLALCLGAIRPDVTFIAMAAFVFLFCEAIVTSSTRSIWQVKVEPGLQGRVLALVTMISNATLAASYAVAGPVADHWFEPLLRRGGSLTGSVGRLMGTGQGRGMALLVLILGAIIMVLAAGGWLLPNLRRLEEDIPDAISDDEPAVAAATHQAEGAAR